MNRYISSHMLSIAACISSAVLTVGGYIADVVSGSGGVIFWICFMIALSGGALLLFADANAWKKRCEQARNGKEYFERIKTERDILNAKLADMQQRLDFAIKGKRMAEQELSDARKTIEDAMHEIEERENQEGENNNQTVNIVRIKEDFCGVSYEAFRRAVKGLSMDSIMSAYELQRGYRDSDEKLKAKNLDIITNAFDSLIYLSNLDNTDTPLNMGMCHLGNVVKECLKKHAAILSEKKIGTLRKGLELHAKTDQRWLSFAISQILVNAINHTNDFGKIAVSGRKSDDGIYIVIEDSGLGSDSAELLRLFEPGFITPEEKRMNHNPTGMSLFMAKHAIEHIGGEIIAESIFGRGTRVHIKLSNN